MMRKHLIALVVLLLPFGVSMAADFEQAPRLKASELLPAYLLKGPYHTTSETVSTDGYFHSFEIKSNFGTYTVDSLEMLKLRVEEINTLGSIGRISGGREFVDSLKNSVVQVPVQAVNMVIHPIASVKNIGKNVKSRFRKVGQFFGGRKKSKYEDNALKSFVLAEHKREAAHELGLDAYSSNPSVQKLLNHVARSRAAGGAPLKIGATVAGVGFAATAVKWRRDINDDLRKRDPSELNTINDKRMKKCAVNHERLRHAILDHHYLSPYHKTVIVANLEALKNVKNRGEFLKTILFDESEEEALFSMRQSDMLLVYHHTREKIVELKAAGHIALAKTKSGKLLLIAPIDMGYYDENAGQIFEKLKEFPFAQNATSRSIVISGKMTPRLVQALKKLGYEVETEFGANR